MKENTLNVKSVSKKDYVESMDITMCRVDDLDDEFLLKHKKSFGFEVKLVEDEDEESKDGDEKEKGKEKGKKGKKEDKGKTDHMVFAIDEEDVFESWKRFLIKRCGKQPEEDKKGLEEKAAEKKQEKAEEKAEADQKAKKAASGKGSKGKGKDAKDEDEEKDDKEGDKKGGKKDGKKDKKDKKKKKK